MRTIKFRSAFYKHDGTFSHFSYWGFIDHKGTPSEDVFTSPGTASGCERRCEEQFICYDKNDENAFEGDIVKTPGGIYRIEYDEDQAGFVTVQIDNNSSSDCDYTEMLWDWIWFEVIGNIHEETEKVKHYGKRNRTTKTANSRC